MASCAAVVRVMTTLLMHTFMDLPFIVASRSRLDCKLTSNGAEYTGLKSYTSSYRACQRWDSQTPHAHSFIRASMFPDGSVSAAENYCRNPGGVRDRPWCYTLHPMSVWEYCEIEQCGCKATKTGWEYAGTVSRTVSGNPCQRWDTQHPHTHSYTVPESFPDVTLTHAHNYCRNPMQEGEGPWCYTMDPAIRWEYCDVPFCECKTTEAGNEYGGRISQTRSGKTCQRWDAQRPHTHSYKDGCLFPEIKIQDAANYCRNPAPEDRSAPWCYTTDSRTRWEFCDIPLCEITNASFTLSYTPKEGPWELQREDVVTDEDDDVTPATVLIDPGVLAGIVASCAVVILGILIGIAMVVFTRRLRQLARHTKPDSMYEMPENVSSHDEPMVKPKDSSGLANPMYENPHNKKVVRLYDYPENKNNERKEARYTMLKIGDMLENKYKIPDI